MIITVVFPGGASRRGTAAVFLLCEPPEKTMKKTILYGSSVYDLIDPVSPMM